MSDCPVCAGVPGYDIHTCGMVSDCDLNADATDQDKAMFGSQEGIYQAGGCAGGEILRMTKDELIAKQQLEIEELKEKITEYKNACEDARAYLWKPEQWSMKCPDFPKVAMHGIVRAREALS